MSEDSNKSVRLGKAAREFNVGTNTIVDYLSKKGFQIDTSPNTKLSEEMYSLLVKEYSSEKIVKEESQKLGIEYSGRKTITADNIVQNQHNEEDEDDIDANELIIKNVGFTERKQKETPQPKKDKPITEKKPEPEKETPAPKKEELKPVVETVAEKEEPKPVEKKPVETVEVEVTEKVEAAKEEPVAATPVEEAADSNESGIRVLGKIDLSSMNMRTKPDRKSKAEKQKEAEAKKKTTQLQKEKSTKTAKKEVADKEKPKAPQEVTQQKVEPKVPSVEATQQEPERPSNFIRTEVKKLEGPKILDKIVLPEERKPKPKPVASSSENKTNADLKKKKRKRIKKDGVAGAAPAGQENTHPTGQGQQRRPTNNNKPAHPHHKGKPNWPPRREEKTELTEEEIQRQMKETLARLSATGGKSKVSKRRREKREAYSHSMSEKLERQEQDKTKLKVTEFVTANDLATMMDIPVTKVIATCMSLGMFVSINQRLDAETLVLVAEEFGFQLEFTSVDVQEALAENEEPDNPEDLVERAPVVTVMGHVDHGKTLLLDFIRKANVIAGEAGGITQHIGAYEVTTESGRKITFLDTPGHEAFTAMRARGAKITDISIIVIAADDSVMPQTVEAINHAQAAGVPIVFAINKVDKPTANPEKIREQLANMNILVEDWGGKFQCQEISAKTGMGIDILLEKVLLEADILELKGNPTKLAKGTVIESALDKGRGYVSKVLVQDGTLHIGDIVLAGSTYGKVKAMFNERNKPVKEAAPSTPVLLLGLNGAPQAGDNFNVMNDDREAKNIATRRTQLQREQGLRTQKHITLDEIGRRIAIGDFKELNLIVKADVDGSVEALSDSLLKLSTEEVQVNVIHKSVGAISESDVMLASASNAIIIGFQVRPTLQARKLAENEEIDIRLYSIIYQAIEEIKAAIIGMLAPEIEEVITCNIEVRETFKVSKVGTVAGCMVLDGKITRNTRIRIIRDGIVIYTGVLGSLKRFKDDVKEVSAGYECGLNVDNFNDIKIGDIIEGFQEKQIARKL
jgi:translation initiation factor IF-2